MMDRIPDIAKLIRTTRLKSLNEEFEQLKSSEPTLLYCFRNLSSVFIRGFSTAFGRLLTFIF
jgi:hypothetical protein